MGHCTILRFGTGARYSRLTLGRPRHQVVAEIDAEAGGGAACIGAAILVGIGVGCELIDGVGAQLQTC